MLIFNINELQSIWQPGHPATYRYHRKIYRRIKLALMARTLGGNVQNWRHSEQGLDSPQQNDKEQPHEKPLFLLFKAAKTGQRGIADDRCPGSRLFVG